MRRRVTLFCALLAAVALALGTASSPALATYPGTDGRIAFGSDRPAVFTGGGAHNIFTMNPDGSDVQQLTFLTVDQGAALRQSWSPDGSKLVFERRPADVSSRDIYVMNADGSNQHVLLSDPGFRDFNPKFSPDGSKVIFSRCRSDFEACAIYAVKADGHGLTAITHFDVKHNVYDSRPEYSPDGGTIAFDSSNRGGVVAAIYLMGAHGSDVRMITPSGLEAQEPDWSPDATSIAFSSNCCNPLHSEIWTVRPNGTGLHQLTFPGTERDATPSYAPTGVQIAFERGAADFSTFSILTMKSDGTDVTMIQADGFGPSWGSAP